ncbi:hypothetical protein NC653_035931 [Populus alba x Populus x berolinensis]|uniref:Uncharacterized protein n=1 Tax=Populus alba x Populus x berolinensis TaxID=444605 RepID=A0AAD6LJ03_9ROSI|nr:hypothetical protein NC653_035931 [Populus alba x Populus x berolinensis]
MNTLRNKTGLARIAEIIAAKSDILGMKENVRSTKLKSRKLGDIHNYQLLGALTFRTSKDISRLELALPLGALQCLHDQYLC